MAVAAVEGRVYLYALKSMREMREELEMTSNIQPIKEVSYIHTAQISCQKEMELATGPYPRNIAYT